MEMVMRSTWRRSTAAFALVLSATIASSALTAGERYATASPQSLNRQLADGYSVGPGDKLRVTVFDEPGLTGEYAVGVDGGLALPLIDAIEANGKSTSQLVGIIARHLQDGGYVLSPRVSVEILEHRPFYILGEVGKPGEYPYSGALTLDQAVAIAGGFTPRANTKQVYLKRQDSSEKVKVRLDGTALKIAPGDTITIREAFF